MYKVIRDVKSSICYKHLEKTVRPLQAYAEGLLRLVSVPFLLIQLWKVDGINVFSIHNEVKQADEKWP